MLREQGDLLNEVGFLFPLSCRSPELSAYQERNKIDALTREQLVAFQYRMLELCCEKGDKDKLPPITSSDISPVRFAQLSYPIWLTSTAV